LKIAIIFNHKKLSGKLTRIFTGCYAYHIVWVDEGRGVMYDMHLIRRRRLWPQYKPEQVLLFDGFPQVTAGYLEHQLSTDENTYGVVDYMLFALRPLYHLFGKSTRNAGGMVCSGMLNVDARNCGIETPWPIDGEEPSPCDWYNWLKTRAKEGETNGLANKRRSRDK